MILGGSHDGQFVRKGCAADGVVAVSVERLGVEYLRILDLCVPADFAVPFLLLGNRPVLLGGVEAGGLPVAGPLISATRTWTPRAERSGGAPLYFCS